MANALGRGLDSLIPTNLDVGSVASPGEQVKNVDVSKLVVNPDQPRKNFDEVALGELARSIKQHGIIQPIVVTPTNTEKDEYRIVAGERRYRAALLAKLTKVPVIVRNHEELEELEIALVENVQRVDLSPLEQAVSVVRLRDQFSLSLKEISKKLGKAETTVSNIIRLLQLPKEAVEALQKNKISEGHARAILALKTDRKLQLNLLNNIITQKLSVRAAESFVKSHKKPKTSNNNVEIPASITRRLQAITKTTGLRPTLSAKRKGGSVKINYADSNELESILNRLET